MMMRMMLMLLMLLMLRGDDVDVIKLVLVTVDGLRWEELYSGVDRRLLDDDDMVMPYVSSYVIPRGMGYGNRHMGCRVSVLNSYRVSAPGYRELLLGSVDVSIVGNSGVYGRGITFLDYLNSAPGYRASVYVYASWERFVHIIDSRVSGVRVDVGSNLDHRKFRGLRDDELTYRIGMTHMMEVHPKVMYFAFGEVDEYAHRGDYEGYINAARRTDDFIRGIWGYISSSVFYRNRTLLVIATDHGRGVSDYRVHGSLVDGSDGIWFIVMGVGVESVGVVRDCAVHQGQIAGLVMGLMGQKTLMP